MSSVSLSAQRSATTLISPPPYALWCVCMIGLQGQAHSERDKLSGRQYLITKGFPLLSAIKTFIPESACDCLKTWARQKFAPVLMAHGVVLETISVLFFATQHFHCAPPTPLFLPPELSRPRACNGKLPPLRHTPLCSNSLP